jgi:DNA-binding NarL/FixJ family response regulator
VTTHAQVPHAAGAPPQPRPGARLDILLVDDHPAVRAGLRALLDDEPDLAVVAALADPEEALERARDLAPDVAVVDYHLGRSDGLMLCRGLKHTARPPRVLLFSAYADGPLAVAAAIAGADGVLGKGVLGDELCRAIRVVARGEWLRPPPDPDALRAVASRLDPGDAPIMRMLVEGTPPDEIAAVLGLSPRWLDIRRWAMLEQLRRR